MCMFVYRKEIVIIFLLSVLNILRLAFNSISICVCYVLFVLFSFTLRIVFRGRQLFMWPHSISISLGLCPVPIIHSVPRFDYLFFLAFCQVRV